MNVAFFQGFLSALVPPELFELDTTILDAAMLKQLTAHGYEPE
jgi:hypothetical protein